MNKSLYQLILIHFRNFYRQPATLFWTFLFPILMAWVLGIAFSNKKESERTVYVIADAEIPHEISGEKVFGYKIGNPQRIKFHSANDEEAIKAIKQGVIGIYIELRCDSMIYHFDPMNSDAQLTHLILERDVNRVQNHVYKTSINPLKTVGMRYIDFLIPGLIALGIMNSCVWGIGWGLVETRMKKLLRRMAATPMRKPIFLCSFIVARIVIGVIETVLLLIFVAFYFGTEIPGSIAALVVVFVSGTFAFSGITILAASRTAKTEVANGLMNLIALPMTFLSGVFFNYHNFPDSLISVIQFLPLTILADSIRAIFIETAGFSEILKPVLILLSTGLITFVLGLKSFKWH